MRGIFLALLLSAGVLTALAQNEKKTAAIEAPPKDSLPYQKTNKLPVFNIRLMDSVTIFNTFNIPTGRPIALVLFSPDCKHCKAMTKVLLRGMDSLKHIDFYFMTPLHKMTEVRDYYIENKFAEHKNIKVVGRDYEFFFHTFYGTRMIPDFALYDKRKKFIKLIEGETTIKDLYESTK